MNMKAPRIYIGVDGGGSKTRVVAVNEHGLEIGRGVAGSSNYRAVGIEQAQLAVYAAVQNAGIGQTTVTEAFIGLAGIDTEKDLHVWQPILQPLATVAHLSNDAEMLLHVFPAGTAAALVAGTGSIAIARTANGSILRCGGWGHIIGDEGSGYDLGVRALRAAMAAYDGREDGTLLMNLILRRWRLPNVDALIDYVYSDRCSKAHIAGIAETVFDAAMQQDITAIALIDTAAKQLAAHITGLIRHGLSGPFSLALGGSLLLQQPKLRETTLEYLRASARITAIELVYDVALTVARTAALTHLVDDFNT